MAREQSGRQAFFIGGGLSALAGAVYLIRDCGLCGEDIHIFEGRKRTGISEFDAERFYAWETCENLRDLLSEIPSFHQPTRMEKQNLDDLIGALQKEPVGGAIRLIAAGLGHIDRLELGKLLLASESELDMIRIRDWFGRRFFQTYFWRLWSTAFLFRPGHSVAEFRRHLLRFGILPKTDAKQEMIRMCYIPLDRIASPLIRWLKENGVEFIQDSEVVDIKIRGQDQMQMEALLCKSAEKETRLPIGERDIVFLNIGGRLDGAETGSMERAPVLRRRENGWMFWENLVEKGGSLGMPCTFDRDPQESEVTFFTLQVVEGKEEIRKQLYERLGMGKAIPGVVQIKNSPWQLVITEIKRYGESESDPVLGGYGLCWETEGRFVPKVLTKCCGQEIQKELAGCLDLSLDGLKCTPYRIPYLTAHLLPRRSGARPEVIPKNVNNFAFIGKYCELPKEAAGTVEYEVRSARIAAYGLTGTDKEIPEIHQRLFVQGNKIR